MRGFSNAISRQGREHRRGCFRWIGDGRCVDCGSYTGIPWAAVEFPVGGVVHYYEPRVAERWGLLQPGAGLPGAPEPSVQATPSTVDGTRAVRPVSEVEPTLPDSARADDVEPVYEPDLIRRDAPLAAGGPEPDRPVIQPIGEHADEGVSEQPDPSPAAVAQQPAERMDDEGDRGDTAAVESDKQSEFRARVRRAREQLALAGQQTNRRA